MGRFFALTLDLGNHTPAKPKLKKMSTLRPNFGFWVIVLFFIIGVFYIMQVNNIATKGYEIKSLEGQLTKLKETNKRLELEASALKSIQTIEAGVKHLNLAPSQGVNYLGSQEGYVYKR